MALATYVGVILLYLVRPFDPADWPGIVEWYVRAPLQLIATGAILWGIGRIEDRRERRFWRLWAIATGIWLSIQLTYAFIVGMGLDGRLLALGIETAVAAFYVCILYSLSLHPQGGEERGGDLVRQSFEDVAVSIFVFALVIYFAVFSFTLKPEAYSSWAPSLTLYVVLDTIVFARLVYLRSHAKSARWVALYTGLAVTAFLWTATDVFN